MEKSDDTGSAAAHELETLQGNPSRDGSCATRISPYNASCKALRIVLVVCLLWWNLSFLITCMWPLLVWKGIANKPCQRNFSPIGPN